MLFDCKGARVERPSIAEGVKPLPGEDVGEAMSQGKGDELHDDSSDEDGRI